MAKINKPLLPIKAHFFFFMAAMGPILPQLSVIGKQIGIAPEMMGYITSILPILFVIAKPIVGFIADYFLHFRKFVFITLITVMTCAFAAFYFIPATNADGITNLHINRSILTTCTKEFLSKDDFCTTTKHYLCDYRNSKLNVYQSNIDFCLVQNITLKAENAHSFVVSCQINSEEDASKCIYGTSTFWLYILLLFIGSIGFNVTNSISDAICFDMLGDSRINKYGAQRVWGTIGFGATALLGGILVDYWTASAVKSFTPALIIMVIFSAMDLLSVSQLRLPKLSSSESIFKDVWSLVKQPAISTFLLFATIAGIIDSFIIYFLFWHLEEVAAATGYMSQIKLIEGCVVAAECLAGEVPFFFYSGRIIKKLGYINCMSMCFFFYAIRLALISWIPNPWYLVLVELFFQGVTYALCYTCIVAYASAVAPPGTSATVQGLMAGMDDGLGFSIGSLVGGLCFKRFGGRRSFLYFSIAAIVTCAAHIFIRTSPPKKEYATKEGNYELPKEQEMNIL